MYLIKQIKRILNNNAGTAIVNVIVLSTMLASVSAILIKLSSTQQKAGVYQSQRIIGDNFADYLRDQLKSPLACTYTFNALTSAGGLVANVQDKKNQTVLSVGQRWLFLRNATGVDAQAVNNSYISPIELELGDYEVGQNIPASATTYEDNDTAQVLERGTMTLKVTYETSDVANSQLSDQAKRNKTYGGISKTIYIPLNITVNSSTGNNIVNCSLSTNIEPVTATVDKSDFVSVPAADANSILCTTLNGIDIGDGTCRHLTFNDGPAARQSNNTNANMYAFKTEGSLLIEPSLINYDLADARSPQKPNDLRVQGSVDIGIHTGFSGPGTYDTPMRDEVTDGELSVDYSVGIGKLGVAPAFTPLDFDLATQGAFVLNHSLSLGEALDAQADPQNGKLRVQSNVVVGQSGFLGGNNLFSAGNTDKGNFVARNSLSIGDMSFATELLNSSGRVNVKNHVVVGNPATNTGNNKNPNSLSGILVGRGMALGTNSDSNVEIRAADISNYSLVAQRNLFLPNFAKTTNFATGSEAERYATTMGWVAHKLANTTDPSSVADVVSVAGDILNEQPAAQKMFESICKGIHIKNADGSFTQGVYSTGRCLIQIKHCSENGECTTVYAGSGGVISQAGIKSTDGDIRATTANPSKGDITASDDITAGDIFKGQTFNTRTNSLRLNNCNISGWSSINIGTSATCEYGVSSCSDNYLAVAIRPTFDNWTYGSGTYVAGTRKSNQKHVSGLTLDCCKLDNFVCNGASTSPNSPPACGSALDTCSVGSFSNRTDTSVEHRWYCTNSPQPNIACSAPKEIDGNCGPSVDTCNSGTFESMENIKEEGLEFPQWKCLGINGGDDAVCPFGGAGTVGRCPYECSDGSSADIYAGDSCGGTWETTEQTCRTGTMSTVSNSGAGYMWTCSGSNTSSSADDTQCEMYTTGCSTTANQCNDGPTASIDSTDASQYIWTCPGGDSCTLPKENNATCGSTEHTCNSSYGTISASGINDNSTHYRWDCVGENGGSSDTNCSEPKPASNDCTSPAGSLGDTYDTEDTETTCSGAKPHTCYEGRITYICKAAGWEKFGPGEPRQCSSLPNVTCASGL